MLEMVITPEWVEKNGGCYEREQLEGLLGAGRPVLEVLDLRCKPAGVEVPIEARTWVGCHALAEVDSSALVQWAVRVARRAVRRAELDIPEWQSWADAVDRGEGYAEGARAAWRSVARAAAKGWASAAAWPEAVWAAAWAASWAADAAAWPVSARAAGATAWATARAVAWAARAQERESRLQLKELRCILRERS